jgi:hypothetical protein
LTAKPVELVGPFCARRGCHRARWKDDLCARCWRFGRVFGKPPELLAYQPLDGFEDEQDAPELSWDEVERLLGDQGQRPA